MDNKFPPVCRVNKKADFQPVLRRGSRLHGRFGKLLFTKSDHPHPRFGMIVSKKAARSSVTRSRIKRVARETFRCHTDLPNLDIVFIAGYNSNQVSNQELRSCLKKLLTQLH